MIQVSLQERSYEIEIKSGALSNFDGEWLDQFDELAVLTNETIATLYADDLVARLQTAGRKVLLVTAPDGEKYKSLDCVSDAYDKLAEFGLTRRGAIIAVGGGVVGDWAGFVAATWMRGVPLVQVPTTLLAMVDSSVGGKTGVNHPRAKNLIGAFHQPQRVVSDPSVLETLPDRELCAGLAEVIKYGVIADADFFNWLEVNLNAALRLDKSTLEKIIARSCEIKAEVVGEDERESDTIGRRAILNYGHTVGHAIEVVSDYGKYLHGEAIAIGMTVAARLAIQLGVIENNAGHELLERQTQLFEKAGLPTAVPGDLDFVELWAAMTLDKKSRGGAVNFILPTKLGQVERVENVSAEAVREAMTTLLV